MTVFDNTFDNYDYLFLLLEDSFIVRFSEYDNKNHCFIDSENCVPLFINKNGQKEVRIRELKNGTVVQTLKEKPGDFKYGTFHHHGLQGKITLHYKSGYYTTFYVKKKTLLA